MSIEIEKTQIVYILFPALLALHMSVQVFFIKYDLRRPMHFRCDTERVGAFNKFTVGMAAFNSWACLRWPGWIGQIEIYMAAWPSKVSVVW